MFSNILSTYKYLLLTSIVMIGLSACTDDILIDDNPQTWVEGDTPYVMKLCVSTSNSPFTRSTRDDSNDATGGTSGSQFDKGLEYEYAIGTEGNFAIIFDVNGRYISCADLYSVNQVENATPSVEEGVVFTTRFYGYTDRKPGQILVVVNATNELKKKIKNFPGWNVSEVMQQIYEKKGRYKDPDDPDGKLGFGELNPDASKDGKQVRYFTMTNASYIENGEVHCAEPITEDNFKTGTNNAEADMQAAADLTPVTVYLERMVAKTQMISILFEHNLYIPPSAQPLDVYKYDPESKTSTYHEYKWGMQIVGWGMNGLETQSHVFKNLDTEGDWLTHSSFNSPYYKRSYWSHDPHYLDEEGGAFYPWQHDDAKDQFDEDVQHFYTHFRSYDNTSVNYALRYYPFEKFCPDIDLSNTEEGYFPGKENYKYTLTYDPVYTPENTFAPGLIVDRSRGSRAYELAGTHALVCARLLLPDEDGGDYKPYTRGNLYRNRVGVTYDDELSMLVDFINAVNYKLASNPQMYFKYYEWDSSKTSTVKQPNINDYKGRTIRATMEGEYALYCYFPSVNNSSSGSWWGDFWGGLFPGLSNNQGLIIELTPAVIQYLLTNENNKDKYKLYREADAVNGDGKVIPWICEKQSDGTYKPLKLMVLKKNNDAKNKTKDFLGYDSNTDTEYMSGDPDATGWNWNTTQLKQYLSENRVLKFQKYNKSTKEWDDYQEYTSAYYERQERDDNDIQSLFFEIWGVAECFNYGLMYYDIPIYAQDPLAPQYNYIAVDNQVSLDTDINQEFANDIKLRYYYGLVRDNCYQFTLHSISDIGVPVSDPRKPIIPNYNNKKDQVKFEMEIIGMHTEDQTVVIK